MTKAAKAAAEQLQAELEMQREKLSAFEEQLKQREAELVQRQQDHEAALAAREEGLQQRERDIGEREAEIAARIADISNRETDIASRELEQLQRDMLQPELTEGSGARRNRDTDGDDESKRSQPPQSWPLPDGRAAATAATAVPSGPISNPDFSAANLRIMQNAASVCSLWPKEKCFRGSLCMYRHDGPGGVTDEAPTPEMAKAFDRATMCLYYACGGAIGCTQRLCQLHHVSKSDLAAIARNEIRMPTYENLIEARRTRQGFQAAVPRGPPPPFRGGAGFGGRGGGHFTSSGAPVRPHSSSFFAPSVGARGVGGGRFAESTTSSRSRGGTGGGDDRGGDRFDRYERDERRDDRRDDRRDESRSDDSRDDRRGGDRDRW